MGQHNYLIIKGNYWNTYLGAGKLVAGDRKTLRKIIMTIAASDVRGSQRCWPFDRRVRAVRASNIVKNSFDTVRSPDCHRSFVRRGSPYTLMAMQSRSSELNASRTRALASNAASITGTPSSQALRKVGSQ